MSEPGIHGELIHTTAYRLSLSLRTFSRVQQWPCAPDHSVSPWVGVRSEDQVSKDKLVSGLGSPDYPGLLRERWTFCGMGEFLVWMLVPSILIYFVYFAILLLIVVPHRRMFIIKH